MNEQEPGKLNTFSVRVIPGIILIYLGMPVSKHASSLFERLLHASRAIVTIVLT